MKWWRAIGCAALAAVGCGEQLVEFPLDATMGDFASSPDLAGADLTGADLAGIDAGTLPDLAPVDGEGQDLVAPPDMAAGVPDMTAKDQ
jgi:hypothetical protein